MQEQQYTITAVSQANAANVATVFRAIYCDKYPVRYVYHANQVMQEINDKRLAAALAFDESGTPVGYVSMYKCAPNPRLWEGGNLLVVPGHSNGNLASMMMQYYLEPQNLPEQLSDGIFGEAVCHHYFTQMNCSKAGFSDCALALEQMDSSSFIEHQPETDRVACLLQFREQSEPHEPVYLPDCYDTILRHLLAPLRYRRFLSSNAPLPDTGVIKKTDCYYESAGTWRVSVSSIGNNWTVFLDDLLNEARTLEVKTIQIILSASLPYTGQAVESMRQKGFFLGGIYPRWFGSDGIMMQLLLDREPDFKGIKLYSPAAKTLLDFIQNDRKTVQG